jgi:hypothetical protein
MKKVLSVVVVVLLAGLARPASTVHAADAASIQAGTVKVTVVYKGKAGQVDPSHKLWVWLFDTPNIGAQATPIDQAALEKNGADAVFQGVAPGQVWVAVAFDEKGAMAGDGPPPSGTPIGILAGKDGAPLAVTPGEKGIVTVTFDDTTRMP